MKIMHPVSDEEEKMHLFGLGLDLVTPTSWWGRSGGTREMIGVRDNEKKRTNR